MCDQRSYPVRTNVFGFSRFRAPTELNAINNHLPEGGAELFPILMLTVAAVSGSCSSTTTSLCFATPVPAFRSTGALQGTFDNENHDSDTSVSKVYKLGGAPIHDFNATKHHNCTWIYG